MREKSFLEILTEKIELQVKSELASSMQQRNQQGHSSVTNFDRADKKASERHHFSSDFTGETAQNDEIPLWISQIPLGKIEFQKPKSQVFGRVYPVNAPRKAPAKPASPRTKHVLTEKQNQAFAYFLGWKLGLKEDFTQDELKKAFRMLAMKLHPDRNSGVTSHYIEMQRHYECLDQVFKHPSP